MKLKFLKSILTVGLALGMLCGCSSKEGGESEVIIYSNADDEAVEAMKNALDSNGYEGKYIFTSFGTSELGGRLLAEGKDIEADLITMSSFYMASAQEERGMFKELTFDSGCISDGTDYSLPITAQEGAIIVNTSLMEATDLPMPTSLKELADPVYSGNISVTDIKSSSTAWLLIQGILDNYDEAEAKEILKGIYKNAGVHIESSGSGPIKKVRAGEVAIGFGLRHQAVSDKAEGLPIDFVDPKEGNYSLTEALGVVAKDKENPLAMEMAECIIKNARGELLESYPIALYDGETTDTNRASGEAKKFSEPLTVDLLKKHQAISEECMAE